MNRLNVHYFAELRERQPRLHRIAGVRRKMLLVDTGMPFSSRRVPLPRQDISVCGGGQAGREMKIHEDCSAQLNGQKSHETGRDGEERSEMGESFSEIN